MRLFSKTFMIVLLLVGAFSLQSLQVSAKEPLDLTLSRLASKSSRELRELKSQTLQSDPQFLKGFLIELAEAQHKMEACLILAGSWKETDLEKKFCFALLQELGEFFSEISKVFVKTVHGDGQWKPIIKEGQLSDGTPAKFYWNTFKQSDSDKLKFRERSALYDLRLKKFYKKGGSFDDILPVASERSWKDVLNMQRYDFVIREDESLVLHSKDRSLFPKMGHSVLATGGPEFKDRPVIMAGELLVYKSLKDEVIAVSLTNSSGHYLPNFSDMPQILPILKQLGVEASETIFMAGPSDIEDMLEELNEKFFLIDKDEDIAKEKIKKLLPPKATDWIRQNVF